MDFPECWPDSLVRAFEDAAINQVRVVVYLSRGEIMRGYLTTGPDGSPAVARVLYEESLYDLREMDSTPESIEDVNKTKGRTVVRWSMSRDEPVMWVMDQ